MKPINATRSWENKIKRYLSEKKSYISLLFGVADPDYFWSDSDSNLENISDVDLYPVTEKNLNWETFPF
jgi:GTP-binding protein EngB required for normal cell division